MLVKVLSGLCENCDRRSSLGPPATSRESSRLARAPGAAAQHNTRATMSVQSDMLNVRTLHALHAGSRSSTKNKPQMMSDTNTHTSY